MATTYTDNGGGAPNGSDLEFTYTFPVIQTEDVKVALNGVTQATTKYAVDTASNPTKITFNNTSVDSSVQESTGAPKSGVRVRVYRETTVGKSTGDDDPKAVYAAGSSIRATDLNANTEQALYAIHELQTRPIETEDIQDSAVTSSKIEDGTIVNADINASAAIDGSKLQISSGSVAGSMSSANFTKLAGIETGATADQTASEIRTLVENATDSNVYTDAEKTKLSGIETGATADQTNAEIRAAVEAASDSNVFTDADHTKLNSLGTLNALSDVDTTGVADNKILKYQASSSKFVIADDTGGGGGSSTFTGLSDSPTNYTGAAGKTVKVNSAGNALEFVTVTTPTQDIVDDTTPQLGGNLDVQASEITTSTTNGNIKLTPDGTGKVEVKGNTNAGSIQLNCENNSHGVTLKGPAHSAGASYTLTLPNNIVNGQFLKTDTNGNLSWAAVDLTALSAANLTSGTIPDARFPATLPAVSGANLTNLPASQYNIQINTLSSSGGSGGGSATFNGSATRFTLSNAGTNAQAHIVSVNGVIQKPNSGTSPSEGFAIDGNDIIFAAAPASGSDFFILTLGNAINIGTPSDNTVNANKLTTDAVTNVKILDDTISEAKLDIHAAPSGTDKVLGYTAKVWSGYQQQPEQQVEELTKSFMKMVKP